jgi:hypothetical protein
VVIPDCRESGKFGIFDVDVMKEDRKATRNFPVALRKPLFIKIDGRLVVVAGPDIASERAAAARNYFVYDTERIGRHVLIYRKAKINVMK